MPTGVQPSRWSRACQPGSRRSPHLHSRGAACGVHRCGSPDAGWLRRRSAHRDVVLVDLLAQCVSPGYLEPFVLLVEADGALHLVATQARLGAVGCRRFDVRGRSGRRTMGRTRLKVVPSNPPRAEVPYSGPAAPMTSAASASRSGNELKIVLAGSPVTFFIMRTTHQANDIFNRRGHFRA